MAGTQDGTTADIARGYAMADADELADSYVDFNVPGEVRHLTDARDGDQIAVTLIRIPAHSDFEHGTGHTSRRSRRSSSSLAEP